MGYLNVLSRESLTHVFVLESKTHSPPRVRKREYVEKTPLHTVPRLLQTNFIQSVPPTPTYLEGITLKLLIYKRREKGGKEMMRTPELRRVNSTVNVGSRVHADPTPYYRMLFPSPVKGKNLPRARILKRNGHPDLN